MAHTTEGAARAAWLSRNAPAWGPQPPSTLEQAAQPSNAGRAVPRAPDEQWLAPGASVLTLDAADEMANVALREASLRSFSPISVCVLDAGGRTIVAKTMIGCAQLTPALAAAKANVCIGLHCSSREFRDKYVNAEGIGPKMPQCLSMAAVGAANGQPLAPFPGGVLCRDTNQDVVCAIGVSGAASDEDEHCAIMAATSLGLLTEPAASQLG